MTLNEFKQWLDGFSRGNKEFFPTQTEWDVIRGKIYEIRETMPLGMPLETKTTRAPFTFY